MAFLTLALANPYSGQAQAKTTPRAGTTPDTTSSPASAVGTESPDLNKAGTPGDSPEGSGSAAESDGRLSPEELEQKVLILERRLEVKEEVEATRAADAPKFTAAADGFTFKSAEDDFSLRIRGLLQADYRHFFDVKTDTGTDAAQLGRYPANLPSTFLLRKVRPFFDVTLWKYASFRIMPDFAGGSLALLDAYGDLAFHPALKIRAGKFTAPLGIERVQSSQDNFFVEYGLSSNLSRNRDVGVQVFGDLGKEEYSYALGLFNGAVDGASKDLDSSSHKDLVGRLFAVPFKETSVEWLRGLGFGAAGAYGKHFGNNANAALPTHRSPGQNVIFGNRALPLDTAGGNGVSYANGLYYSYIPQGYWFVGPFGLLGEYAFTSQEVRSQRPSLPPAPQNPVFETPQESQAWLATVTWVVTGEPTSYKGVRPRHPYGGKQGGFGALELVARAGHLDADVNGTFPTYANPANRVSEATSYGGGFNWYLNRAVKITVDYEQTQFKGGNRTGVVDRDDEKVLTTRFQFAY